MTPAELARLVDHTLLRPEATRADVRALATEAAELGVFSICVSPGRLHDLGPLPPGLALATVCGFPSGAHHPAVKAAEAARAVAEGADEVDMVIDVGRLRAGDVAAVRDDVTGVREAVGDKVLKVIIESAALSDSEIVAACRAAAEARADLVKTSTGFHPAGGATVAAVELMARTVGDRLGVKASGGIRSWDEARAMVAAGATRLGLSATRAVLAGHDPASPATRGQGY